MEFLDYAIEKKLEVEVAFHRKMLDPESLTIVGDWFSAESISTAGGQGYRHTVFTRHAPSVAASAEQFDRDFDTLRDESGWEAGATVGAAKAEICEVILELRAKK